MRCHGQSWGFALRRTSVGFIASALVLSSWTGSGAPGAQAAEYSGTIVGGMSPAYCTWTVPCLAFMRHDPDRCSVAAYNKNAALYRDAGLQTAIVNVGAFRLLPKRLVLTASNTGTVNVEFYTTTKLDLALPAPANSTTVREQGWCGRIDVQYLSTVTEGTNVRNIDIPQGAQWMTITSLAGLAKLDWRLTN